MSIFLGNLALVEGTKYQVGFIHNMPFDEEHGIKDESGNLMTADQLSQMGVLIDSMPLENPPQGQQLSGIFVDRSNNQVSYTYGSIPLTPQQIMDNLQSQNAQMLLALVQGGLM